jgi:osmoprotectant transport system substrate-binding protein
MKRKVLLGVVAAVLGLALAACGSSSNTKTNVHRKSEASEKNAGATKPPVTIGDKNFTEEYILGSLYQQALQARGYHVALKGNIGSSEITYKALTSGQIQMYPEYTGEIVTTIAGITNPPHSASQTYSEAQAYVHKHGFTLLKPTPFYDTDAMGTLKSYATKHHLHTISDLKRLGHSLVVGGDAPFATRLEGLVGLKRAYGINPTFKPLTIGLIYKALDSSQVQVSDVFTTDPQLTTGKYTILSDPKNVFGFQNVAPIVKKSVLKAEGPVFEQTINKVSALLTLDAIRKMNAAVALDQQSPAAVAHKFLEANHLG